MAWQPEANATLGSPPLLPLPRRISDEDAEFVVILIVISLEYKLRTSSQLRIHLQPSYYPLLTGIPHHTEQLFTMVLKGHCLCKAVTYTVDVDQPLITGYDHCDDCQRQSGSTYSLVAVVPKDKLTLNGPTKSWAGKGSLGKDVHRIFCSECGSPIAHDPDAAPEIIAIKAGTLDTEIKKTLKPDTEIWTKSKLPFMKETLAKPFEGMPE
ncbi:hypothetical protein FJTKL_10723 [Diaporthe vaccinii]|uniref:CENP-V/GFA domain-containing protein n=1 Tax=Diaporthe vaccinii TaxID=105482 RepID=A0ABR4FBH5_9PEZI